MRFFVAKLSYHILPYLDATISVFINNAGTYNSSDTHEVWLLIVWNVLFVVSFNHNLIHIFILRKDSMIVNYRPKIHQSAGLSSSEDRTLGNEKTGILFHCH